MSKTAAPRGKKRATVTRTETPTPQGHPSLSGLSRTTQGHLAKLGIATRFDLVLHLPLRYDDETRVYAIADAPPGQDVVVEGDVIETTIQYRPRRQLVCQITDGSETLTLRFFNFYPSQQKQLSVGTRIRVFGAIRTGFFGAEIVHPRYRVVRGDMPVPEALTPVYPATAGMSQDELRKLIRRAVSDSDLSDTLEGEMLQRLKLPPFDESVRYLHNPPPDAAQDDLQLRRHPAWQRIKFDELLAQQLSMRLHYRRRKSAGAPALHPKGQLAEQLLAALPFGLTGAQQRALAQLKRDVARPYPMQRLLQGDVGSGKTIVAALVALQAVEGGHQVAIMAPTEILAEQHYLKFQSWLAPLGITVGWLAGSLRAKERKAALAAVANGETRVAVGTHALFQDEVRFANLALAIIDEQHRFGVHQRLALRMKGAESERGVQPHQLMMSATPIPRTLAMSFYADLDVSVIDEMPPGRTPVTTKLISDERREEVIHRVRDACLMGSQAYWVCPLIEESEALQLKTAQETYETLAGTFPELRVGLVHGRMKSDEKTAVMAAFKQGELHLLVSTTVIEVGVDVPNASLMIIENAERMGLSQLHQLRGRVGRGAAQSTCILLYQRPLGPTALERLKIIYEHTDGFEVAQNDLRIRGPGELLGARQSGVPMLRFADLVADVDLLEAARNAAEHLLEADPARARSHLARWLGGRQEYLKV